MRAIVHIGFHKTGTTSIQAFLNDNRAALATEGIAFYQGRHIPGNHVELHVGAMRDERTSPFKLMLGGVPPRYGKTVAAEIANFRNDTDAHTILFSAEGLSYLRYPDEMNALRSLIGIDDITIVAYLREAGSWIESYKVQIAKHPRPDVIGKDSFAYVERDSWLLDFPTRIAAFEAAFGKENVSVLDYDSTYRRDGNVIPSFLDAIGVPALATADINRFRLNVRQPAV
jgi:hypothetical protein